MRYDEYAHLEQSGTAKIKVIGVGGGGTNAVSTMIRGNIEGVDFIAANTDVQSLRFSLAPKKIQLGKELTKGLGAGADPDIGRDAALEDRHEIQESLSGSDMVFITAGMGGGTGTGGASIAAQIAKDQGALTVGVVTKPFAFEGKRRMRHAELGIERLREYVDTLIVIPNQRLLHIATPDLSMVNAFKLADTVLVNAVKGISDIINIPGFVNVDFADVKAIMSSTGQALMGIGMASGEGRAVEAAHQAISSPLLEDIDIQGATGILINITAGETVTLMEVNEACSIIQQAAHEDANIVFGAVIDPSLGTEIRVTVIATGFPTEASPFAGTYAPMERFKKRAQPTPISAIAPTNFAPKIQKANPVINQPLPSSQALYTNKEPSFSYSQTSAVNPILSPLTHKPHQPVAQQIPHQMQQTSQNSSEENHVLALHTLGQAYSTQNDYDKLPEPIIIDQKLLRDNSLDLLKVTILPEKDRANSSIQESLSTPEDQLLNFAKHLHDDINNQIDQALHEISENNRLASFQVNSIDMEIPSFLRDQTKTLQPRIDLGNQF